MSIENAQELLNAITNDSDSSLKQRFQQAGPGGFEEVAASSGFPCTMDELKAAGKLMAIQALSDPKTPSPVDSSIGAINIGVV